VFGLIIFIKEKDLFIKTRISCWNRQTLI